jgi:DNA-binding LacI/PurR family transcriptional regulator
MERQGGVQVSSTTIAEVAKRAGVSPATVSYVLSGNRTISHNTQARVRRAIQDLSYTPHAGARSLRAGKTDVVAVVVPFYDWSSQTVLMPFVYGIVDQARQQGWKVMLVTSDGGADVASLVRSRMVDGVILMEVRGSDERLEAVERLQVPAVALGMPLGPVSIPFVDLDFEAAARSCVERLVTSGHRNIALLASPPGTFEKKLGYARRFWQAVAAATDEAGLAFHGLPVEPTMEGTQRALEGLLAEEPSLTGLIVQTEAVADLLLRIIQHGGKSVPEDFSLVGVAWRESVRHLVPALTYVDFPSVEIGRRAIDLLAQGGPGSLLPPVLVEGATVAPARRAQDQRTF